MIGLSSDSAIRLASQSTFEVALQQRLQKILTPAELESFRIAQQNISVDELLSKVKRLDDAYNQTSTSRRYARPLTEVFQIISQFMSGVAIGIQASPEISSLVVGGVRIVIDVSILSIIVLLCRRQIF
jgi:ankyrin repeat domain-containing protein 50